MCLGDVCVDVSCDLLSLCPITFFGREDHDESFLNRFALQLWWICFVALRSFMSMEMALKQIVLFALSESSLTQLTVFEPWHGQVSTEHRCCGWEVGRLIWFMEVHVGEALGI